MGERDSYKSWFGGIPWKKIVVMPSPASYAERLYLKIHFLATLGKEFHLGRFFIRVIFGLGSKRSS